MKTITRNDFIQKYILPNENKEMILDYYKGTTDFDNDYLLEVAQQNNLKITDLLT